jgi:hypothetical protein
MKSKSEIKLYYDPEAVSIKLMQMLDNLAEEYPLSTRKSKDSIILNFLEIQEKNILKINLTDNNAVICYSDISLAARAVGILLSGIIEKNVEYIEQRSISLLGIMLDCSRNAVINVSHFRKWLRRLALMGYNAAMLYTEDTYQIDGEKYFGFMRGAYTPEELRSIDDYASGLGIEMIPCIQTLGHMEQVLKNYPYARLRDTFKVIMTDNEDSYALIEKMIRQCRKCFRSRRIHIGMDEAVDMGRGKSLDKFGYRKRYDIFADHLNRLMPICEKHSFKPMIWSDMFFRLASKNHDYYDNNISIPESIKEKIPPELDVVYWNYNDSDVRLYANGINKHKDLGKTPVVASGIHTWGHFWHNHIKTENQAGPCIEACVNNNINELFFTMWGDDGAYCDFDSAMSGLLWCAEKVFHCNGVNSERIKKESQKICFRDYELDTSISQMYYSDFDAAKYLLWDDSFYNLNLLALPDVFKESSTLDILNLLNVNIENVVSAVRKRIAGEYQSQSYNYIIKVMEFLLSRLKVCKLLIAYYDQKQNSNFILLVRALDEAIKAGKSFDEHFRAMWLKNNKPYGMEVIQIRNAGIVKRLEELRQRIQELNNGQVSCIPEIDEFLDNLKCSEKISREENTESPYWLRGYYKSQATPSAIL